MSDEKKIVWESVSVTPEEVKRILDEREGGRKAGRGDSPWTQEFYEETYGIKKKTKNDRSAEQSNRTDGMCFCRVPHGELCVSDINRRRVG